MGEDDITFEMIDRIYDVAVDPSRYEAMLDAWERRLSGLRREAEAGERPRIRLDSNIEAHVDRATIFLQRLVDEKLGPDRSPLDLDVKAAFVVGPPLRVEQANRAAEAVIGLRNGDPLERLPLGAEDVATLRATLRKTLRPDEAPPVLLRFASADGERPILFHLSRQGPGSDGLPRILVRTTEVGWPEHLSRTMRDAFALTAAEVEVVRALAEGKSLRAIAIARKRSPETIKSQVAAILAKTGTHSQAELIRITLGLMDVVGGAAPAAAGDPGVRLAPLPFQSMRLPDGRRYDFIEFGDPAGRPCLFLPIDYGMIRWPRRAEVAALQRGLRVVVPVRAGYGHSSPQPKGVRSYAEATGSDLLRLMDHLGLRRAAVLTLGADFRFALALAVRAPERVAGILGCSAALPVMTAAQYERMGKWHRFILANARYAPQLLPFLVKAGFALAKRIGKERFFRSVNADSPADMRTFDDPEIREAILLGTDVCLGPAHSAHDAFARECVDSEADWSALLQACTVPVRLLQGAEDPQTPAETVRELTGTFPHCDIEIVEEAGTLLFFQMWPRVLALLEDMLPPRTAEAAAAAAPRPQPGRPA